MLRYIAYNGNEICEVLTFKILHMGDVIEDENGNEVKIIARTERK